MSSTDQFESFRRRREVELLESSFREKAAEKRKRIEAMLEAQEDSSEVESVVAAEMEEFLSESTSVLSEVLGDDADVPSPEIAIPPPPSPAPPASPPPSAESGKQAPLDLKAALARIRKQDPDEFGGDLPEPEPPAAAAPSQSKDLLRSFDEACEKVAGAFREERDAAEGGLPPQDDILSGIPREPSPRSVRKASHLTGEPPLPGPSEHAMQLPEPIPDPTAAGALSVLSGAQREGEGAGEGEPAGAGEQAGAGTGGPAGSTNVFESEPDEDTDIDDDLEESEPGGWNLPVREPPPGAWVVERQKQEGDAGLAGSAGDTYLIKKLCQEVRGLNRMYLVLIEKGVVTREEVEGPLAASERDSEVDDDDDFSVDDYSSDRYRPILIDEKDFSLSALVADVHRLKALRETLVKKGILAKKDLDRQSA